MVLSLRRLLLLGCLLSVATVAVRAQAQEAEEQETPPPKPKPKPKPKSKSKSKLKRKVKTKPWVKQQLPQKKNLPTARPPAKPAVPVSRAAVPSRVTPAPVAPPTAPRVTPAPVAPPAPRLPPSSAATTAATLSPPTSIPPAAPQQTSSGRTLDTFKVLNSDCPVRYIKWGSREWLKWTTPIPRGTVVRGLRVTKNNHEIVVFRMGSSTDKFAAGWACMFAKPSELPAAHKDVYAGWNLFLGAISWQESFDLVTPAKVKYPLKTSVIGICPGDGWQYRWHEYDLGVQGCLAYGKAQVSPTGSAIGQIDYEARNVNVLSILAGPTGLWRPSSGSVAFGLMVPLMARFALWPEPSGGYTVGQRLAFKPGALIEARIERDTVSISQRVGFLGRLTDMVWFFSLNKDFR